LRDADLKARINPQQIREAAATMKDAGPSASGNTTNTTSGVLADHHQTVIGKSLDATGASTAVSSKHESADVSAAPKEMETDVIRQIVQRMSLRSDGRQSQMQIKLKPEFLGNLKMDVITENRMVMVRMTAENHSVKEMIEQNIGMLKTELQQQGLQVQKVDVSVAQDNEQWAGGGQQAAFEQTGQGSGRRQGNRRSGGGDAKAAGDVVEHSETTVVSKSRSSEVDFFA
jgi:flagellar hook-length control protein FliK